ncbi:MAG: hypothetical protein JWN74_1233 [Acidobacteriaceae bacterium]|nr:hypothetical protein [Acidobacteriaceae bacterium]
MFNRRNHPGSGFGIVGADWEQAGVAGIEILEISQSGPAGVAGLRSGDVITTVNGKNVHTTQELANLATQLETGSTVKIVYMFKTQLGWMPKTADVVLP